MRPTYHLVSAEAWAASGPGGAYAAASLAAEGFIHCTDGADEMVLTANRHYRADPRPFLLLTVDLDACGSPWRIEDERGIYPRLRVDRAGCDPAGHRRAAHSRRRVPALRAVTSAG